MTENPSQNSPPDDLDLLLSGYLRAELPTPFPPLTITQRVLPQPPTTPTRHSPAVIDRGRATLALSLVVMFCVCYFAAGLSRVTPSLVKPTTPFGIPDGAADGKNVSKHFPAVDPKRKP